jgi:hypothetical protein
MTDDPSDRRDPYQKEAAENERSDRPQYHHDATKGETRYPPESGYQHAGDPGERDVHSRLNTPLSELEASEDVDYAGTSGPTADVTGMGSSQRGDTNYAGGGDPVFGGRPDRETVNPAQNTPRGVVDAETEAVRAAEEATGVRLLPDDDDGAEGSGGRTGSGGD